MRARGWLGGLGHPGLRAIRQADAVLDISGGDSFTDLYGLHRFNTVALPKLIALEQRTPLILLPQTYGPFQRRRLRRVAERIVRRAAMAWTRDERSFESLRGLLGTDFDPTRHRCGVDVAFALQPCAPAHALPDAINSWLNRATRGSPLVGFNISGLIYNGGGAAARQYRLRADYGNAVLHFVRRLLDESDAVIILIPHVLTRPGHYESDIAACADVIDRLPGQQRHRIAILPPPFTPAEVKWVIAQADWFCGTRMHSTIAALSRGVPTAAIAYSDKTRGVFETCGQGEHVADPRELETEPLIERLWFSWCARREAAESLAATLPNVLHQADAQMDLIVEFIAGARADTRNVHRTA